MGIFSRKKPRIEDFRISVRIRAFYGVFRSMNPAIGARYGLVFRWGILSGPRTRLDPGGYPSGADTTRGISRIVLARKEN